jgi:hypothetical protein
MMSGGNVKIDKWFTLLILGLVLAPPLGGLAFFIFGLSEVAVGLWVATYFCHILAANMLGAMQGKRDLIAGARAVLEAQQVNDRWDVQKTEALAQFARVIYATKPGAQPEVPPTMLLDGQWSEASVPQLEEFTIKG